MSSSPGYSVPERIQERPVEAESGIHPDLDAALRELEEADQEAEENGWALPSSAALRNARSLLPRLYRLPPERFSVYPLFNGEIVLDATTKSRHSVVVICEADGSVLCLVNIRRRDRRAKYSDASDLPDGFIREAFRDLVDADEQTRRGATADRVPAAAPDGATDSPASTERDPAPGLRMASSAARERPGGRRGP